MLVLAGFVLAFVSTPNGAFAAQEDAAKPSMARPVPDDLDAQLLEGLDAGLRREADSDAGGSDLDRRLMQQLGEDIGREESNPLRAISQQMRTVKSLIAQQVTSEKTQRLQSQIVADLDKLIEQLKEECQGGQCNNPGSGSPKPGAKGGKPSRSGSGEVQGTPSSAKESVERIGKKAAGKEELERVQAMLKQIWGHLPPELQQQIESASHEEFLPKYESLIEDYFRRLAKENPR
jgi:hypothetical protein